MTTFLLEATLPWTSLDTWIIITGSLAAIACALPGNFLILRGMSMMGDAITHAVLPGLALAFLLTGSRGSLVIMTGAVAIGLLTALLVHLLHRWGRVDNHASIGIVFTTFFAVGLILIVRGADMVDLDPDCVLYGAIEYTSLDRLDIFGFAIPRATVVLGGTALFNALFILLFFKELAIGSFDPELAASQGFRPDLLHLALMAIVAITTVAGFEAVGSILVVAMLIVPGATAFLLTNRLHVMVLLSVVIAAMGAVLGHLGAILIPPMFGFDSTTTAGSMATASGLLFAAALIFSPRHGIAARMGQRWTVQQLIVQQDILGLIYRMEEHALAESPVEVLRRLATALPASPLRLRLGLRHLRRTGMISVDDGILCLRDEGRLEGARLIRSHRLWESYLVKHLGLRPDHVHRTAMDLEHITDSGMRRDLAHEVGEEETDPHGRDIPPPLSSA